MNVKRENLVFGVALMGFGLIAFGNALGEIIPSISGYVMALGGVFFGIGLIFHTIYFMEKVGDENFKNPLQAIKKMNSSINHVSFNKNATLVHYLFYFLFIIPLVLVLIFFYPSENVLFPKFGTILFFAFPFGYGLALIFRILE